MNTSELIAYIIAIGIPVLAIYLIDAFDLFGTGKISTVLICMGGGVFAFFIAYQINVRIVGDIGRDNLVRFAAPVIEEILKSLILVYLIQRPAFRYIVDGATYGFGAGIGFAVAENIDYLSSASTGATLSLAISRVLSASLMHATASAMVGISLGRIRRSRDAEKFGWPVVGIVTAIAIHVVFNNLVNQLAGSLLLLVAIGIGLGGGFLIVTLIQQGLGQEKKRFAETLGLSVGVTAAESKAVQKLGSQQIEQLLIELGKFFGEEKVKPIRRLFVAQANIGILKNNLRNPTSDRLREAWEADIEKLRQEIDEIRNELGVYIMSFIRNVFPSEDAEIWDQLTEGIGEFDPEHVHRFDVFMNLSKLAQTITPQDLEKRAVALQKISIFENVPLAELENLSRAIVQRRYVDGQVLFDQGDEGDSMYLIEKGGISIYTVDKERRQKFLRTFEAGQPFGELALMDGQPRSARARATGSLEVLMLPRQQFNMFIQSRPQVILEVLRFLAEKVRFTTRALEDSANWASQITKGEFNPSALMETVPAAKVVPPSELPDENAPDPMEIPQEAAPSISGMFLRAQLALDKRDATRTGLEKRDVSRTAQEKLEKRDAARTTQEKHDPTQITQDKKE